MDTVSTKKNNSKKQNVTTHTSQTLLAYGVEPYQLEVDEEYMSDKQLEHFKNILTKWKLDLLEGGDDTIHELQEANKNSADLNDQATETEIFAIKLKTRARASKLIKKIEESLDLVEKKDYGYCEGCGVEIGVRRLEARPTATLCIDCKTLAEMKEKQKN